MEKICNRCKQTKPISEFSYKNKVDGKLQSFCKKCNTLYSKEWYKQNKVSHLKTVRKNDKIMREAVDTFINNLKSSTPCYDCKLFWHPWQMDFDHINALEKINAIAMLRRDKVKLETIKKEIEKCQLVCANCHRMRTYLRAKQKYNLK